ncbi:MAG: YigZ family protein [Acidobacteriota bacterium]
MSSPSRYPVPAAIHRIEEEISHSRFITTIARAETVDAAVAFVDQMRREFDDATHNCWAYVVGPPGDTGRVGMSDDGEPHGTAGRPMLAMLLHSGVGDVAAVVTRYYGGTKLGTGGLVRAYSGGVQKALAAMPRGEHVESTTMQITVSYAAVSAMQQIFPAFEVDIVSQTYEADVTYRVRLPGARAAGLRAAVLDATRGQAGITPSSTPGSTPGSS